MVTLRTVLFVCVSLLALSIISCIQNSREELAEAEALLASNPTDQDSLTKLIRLSKHRDPFVRNQAIVILRHASERDPVKLSPRVLPSFIEGLTDPDGSVRREAALSIASLDKNAASAIEPMGRALLQNPNSDVALFLSKAMARMPEKADMTIPFLVEYCDTYKAIPPPNLSFNQDVLNALVMIVRAIENDATLIDADRRNELLQMMRNHPDPVISRIPGSADT